MYYLLRNRDHAKKGRVVSFKSISNVLSIYTLSLLLISRVVSRNSYYYCKFKIRTTTTTTTTKNKKKTLSRLQAVFASCELIELLKRKEINLVKYWKMFFYFQCVRILFILNISWINTQNNG